MTILITPLVITITVIVGFFTIIGIAFTVGFILEQRDNNRRLEQDREEELLMGQKYRML